MAQPIRARRYPITRVIIGGLSLCLAHTARNVAHASDVYADRNAPINARVNDLFGRLTQDEKRMLLTGTGFGIAGIPRLGIAPLQMADAGQGVRGGTKETLGPATAFPAAVTMASTWDPELVGRIGAAIGVEALNKGPGVQVLLGPAVNIQRSPLGGRNGEYFSEDPYLSSRLTVAYIKGMQGTGEGACVKHFACNNQETGRDYVDVNVGERALREIYLPSFEAAVKEAGVWAVMSSYNQVNGYHASANHYLLTDVLKRGWGFDGVVMSDWGGVHETAGVLNAGNDLEMPGGDFLTPAKLASAVDRGELSQAVMDDSVRRIVKTIIRVGLADGPRVPPDPAKIDSPAHRALTLEAAIKGIVLLKNDGGALPIDASAVRSIAVIGAAAADPQINADGSPRVDAVRSVSPLEGIRKRAGDAIKVTYVAGDQTGMPLPADVIRPGGDATGVGWRAEYFADQAMADAPLATRVDPQIGFDWRDGRLPPAPVNVARFAVRWTGTLIAPATGTFTFAMSGDDGYRLAIGGKVVVEKWRDGRESTTTGRVELVKGESYPVRAEYFQSGGDATVHLNWMLPEVAPFADAVAAARAADVALVFVTTKGTEGEGNDRPSLALPNDQDALIRAVGGVNQKTVVILNNGTPVLMDAWLDRVPALVESWFPGQEGGNAIAAILFGDANPSGKLPTTLGRRREDYSDVADFPGAHNHVQYAEGIYVGYRHFDKEHIEPLFPFGYGLSYTTFRYANPRLSSAEITPADEAMLSVDITNTGRRAGVEIVQLYAHDPQPHVDRPTRELKGFRRVELAAGETKTVTMPVGARMFAYCDVGGKRWRADAGTYELEVGASSRDVRLTTPVRLTADYVEAIPLMNEQSPAFPAAGDVAAYRPTTSSSVEKPTFEASQATDGNNSTRWSSKFADGEWLAVDLGTPVTIDRVRLRWEAAYASDYTIQASDDGQSWKDVVRKSDGTGGIEQVSFAPTATRWVRLHCTKRGTQNGVSLYSVEVFAAAEKPAGVPR